MKLLLVNPNFKGVVLVPSLGLGFIGTYLKKQTGCEVEIVEPILQGLSEDDVLKKAQQSDIIGLVCYTESRFQCFEFAQRLKQINPAARVIIGGPHVNTLDELILRKYPFLDIVVRMEGEEAVSDIARGRPLVEISGITWRNQSGEIIKNTDRVMLEDIDALGYDYSLVFSYLKKWKDSEIPHQLQRLNAIPIIGSRGCPFRCSFCAASGQWGQSYRWLSPEELVGRIERLIAQYNIRYFRFYDALFIGTDERILKFCDLIEKSKLDISFRIDIRAGTERETLRRLRYAGCDVVGIGVESGSDRILERINKCITKKGVRQTLKICRELGYWIMGFFMISLPDETTEDMRQTLELFNLFDGINLQIFKIHHNTTFYNELKQNGEIDDSVWFNPEYGITTRYGNEIYYCKDRFPSANFYWDEVSQFLKYAFFKFNVDNPSAIIRNRGLMQGIPIISLSAFANTLLRYKTGKKLYL